MKDLLEVFPPLRKQYTYEGWANKERAALDIEYAAHKVRGEADDYYKALAMHTMPDGCVFHVVEKVSFHPEGDEEVRTVWVASPIKQELHICRQWGGFDGRSCDSLYYWNIERECFTYVDTAYEFGSGWWMKTLYRLPNILKVDEGIA